MTKPLKVYKASAGSGKTFTLAVEYIKLLVQNPEEYKFILAVTFTNKATGEMKNRILSTLYGLSNHLPDADKYLDALKRDETIKNLSLTDEQIRERCGDSLHRIIHDYSRFRIETIDSFFQSIIRDLTRELDLTANLRVDLNAQEVLEEAVDEIIDEIDTRKDVFDAVLHFVEEKITSGSNWRINEEVSDFGKNIFKEDFLRNREIITRYTKDARNLIKYKKDMQSLKQSVLEDMKQKGEAFLKVMESSGIRTEQLKYGNNLEGFIRKLINGELPEVGTRIIGYVSDPSANLVKDKKAADIIVSNLHEPLKSLVASIPSYERILNTVEAVCKHINHLMLLHVINEKVRELNSEANRFLLADTAHFLNEIIDGSDVPFIYEKAGTWFRHIMIDEFQDTSALQWENFKPLIGNSMSNKESCLIVGDVKQSIYRWRDSDWQILNKRINMEFNGYIDEKELKTNYRSAGNVIHFNNQFFAKAVDVINPDAADLKKAYADVRQEVPSWNEGRGFVMVDNLVSNAYTEATPQRILDTVKELHEQGVAWNDMTILVRKNKFIPTLCQFFNEHGSEIDTRIISDEAFRLDSSSAVNLLILALTAISHPADKFALRNLAIHYQMAQQGDADIKNDANDYFLEEDEEKIEALLPEGFVQNMEKYSFTPLHELIEELYNVLSLKNIEGQDAYLFYFYDQINNYVQDNQTDLDSFLSFWEETLSGKTIPNGASDGIRIMSIHKSKGLEFHTVIVPYCDWDIDGNRNDLLWCEPSEEPYSNLPVVPVNSTSKLDKSIFRSEYREEVLKNNVDNLNLIYVAFTRASENLVVLTGMKPKKKVTSVNNIQQVIEGAMKCLMTPNIENAHKEEKPVELNENTDNENTVWTLGRVVPSKTEEVKSTDNVLEMPYTDIDNTFVHEVSNVEFRQSNESRQLVLGDDDEEESEDYLQRGLIYHRIFELIKTRDDVDRVIDELDGRGYFDSVVSVEDARKNIKASLDNPLARRWYDDGWKEFKECTIIYKEGNKAIESRPDRVITNNDETIVIDYKSGKKKKSHTYQVRQYMNLLHQMGYKNIKGYIWYFMQNEIEEVKTRKGGQE